MMHAMAPPGRDDSCPCGSGKKYKQCCGLAVPLLPQRVWRLPLKGGSVTTARLAVTDASKPPFTDGMMRFSQPTGVSFFYEENGETLGYGSRQFQEAMASRIARGEPLW